MKWTCNLTLCQWLHVLHTLSNTVHNGGSIYSQKGGGVTSAGITSRSVATLS